MPDVDYPMYPSEHEDRLEHSSFPRRVLIALGIAVLVLFLLWLARSAVDVFLLLFGGLLFGLFLRSLTRLVRDHTPLADRWALATVLLGIVALLGLGGWLLGPRIVSEANQLVDELPRAADQLRQQVQQYRWGEELLARIPPPGQMAGGGPSSLLSSATGIVSRVIDLFTYIGFILSTGIFFAASPRLYQRGVIRLFPHHARPRAEEVLDTLGHSLTRWLVGQAISMTVVGVLTAAGLWLIGVPLALTLGLIAGLLEFIPLIGPLISYVPGVLLALSQGPTEALYTLGLYLLVQAIEGYVLMPLVFKEAVDLPPVLTLTSQTLMGLLFGFLGLLFATPLVASALVLVRMLYVEDVLGDTARVPGEDAPGPAEERVAARGHPGQQPAASSD